MWGLVLGFSVEFQTPEIINQAVGIFGYVVLGLTTPNVNPDSFLGAESL